MSELSGKIRLGNWDFNVMDIRDKSLYSNYIKKTQFPANLWSTNFDFLWAVSQAKTRKVLWRIVDDMLVTFGYLRSGILYLIGLPFGDGDPDKLVSVLYKCFRYCYSWNDYDKSSTVLKVINSMQLEFLRKSKDFDKHFRIVPLIGLEKHFSIPKLMALSGKEFETVRRKVNKFHRLCPSAVIREYTPNDYESVMQLGEYWSKTEGQKYSGIFDRAYFPEIIKHCQELNHTVLVVEVGGKIIGMVSGGELPTGQSWWCISKYMSEFDGLSDVLVIEIAKAIHKANPAVELMNAAEDLGSDGLRLFKERFRPVLDLKRYVIKLR